jgi:hypothetical protein
MHATARPRDVWAPIPTAQRRSAIQTGHVFQALEQAPCTSGRRSKVRPCQFLPSRDWLRANRFTFHLSSPGLTGTGAGGGHRSFRCSCDALRTAVALPARWLPPL